MVAVDRQQPSGMRIRWELLLIPPVLISLGLLFASQIVFLGQSFYEDQGMGRVGDSLTLGNYAMVLAKGSYLKILTQTVLISLATLLLCILIGYPAAYLLARMRSRWGPNLLALILCSSFITIVVKVLGLVIIFGNEGPINSLLLSLGVIDRPLRILGSVTGVVIGLVQFTIGFFIVMMFGIIRTIPRSLEEAAEIHGASRWRVMARVVIPLSLPGLASASLIAFSLSMGAFASPALLGGGRVLTLPIIIQQTLLLEARYGVAAALSAILLLTVLAVNLIAVRYISNHSYVSK